MMRILILVLMIVSILLATALPAAAIVHGVTPSNECGASANAGGFPAAGVVVSRGFTPPVPVDASGGSMQGKASVPGACS
jgi:hypothetical protein